MRGHFRFQPVRYLVRIKPDGCSYSEERYVIVFHFFVHGPNGNAEKLCQLFDCKRFLFGSQLLDESHFGECFLVLVFFKLTVQPISIVMCIGEAGFRAQSDIARPRPPTSTLDRFKVHHRVLDSQVCTGAETMDNLIYSRRRVQ
jgi:hypothetical protein